MAHTHEKNKLIGTMLEEAQALYLLDKDFILLFYFLIFFVENIVDVPLFSH